MEGQTFGREVKSKVLTVGKINFFKKIWTLVFTHGVNRSTCIVDREGINYFFDELNVTLICR